MKISTGLIFAIIWFSACSSKHYTIIKDVDVFDGEVVHKEVDFAFSEDGIEYISPERRPRRNSTIIDGSSKSILPPMINAHVHVKSAENLKEALKSGIFGMLDMFGTDRRANYFRTFNESLQYAQFYSSNLGATPPGGHGTQFRITIPTISDSHTVAVCA